MKALTQSEKNILLNQYMGEKPRRMWRVWYNKERDYGSISIPTRQEAERYAIVEERFLKEIGESPENYLISEPEEYDDWSHAINYFNNFDAVHEFEKELTNDQHTNFRKQLGEVVGDVVLFSRKFTSATASQRAEALGLALNLW